MGDEVNQFKRSLKRYLEIHEQEEKLKDEIKQMKDERDGLENYLLEFIEQNDYQDRDIVVGDYKMKYTKNKQTESVTKKMIYERLMQYFQQDEEQVTNIMNSIYNDRNVTIKTSLKLSSIKK